MNQLTDRKVCGEKAAHRFTWPGNDESFICENHVGWLRKVASAMSLHLQVIPLGDDVDETCRQESQA